MEPHTPDPKSSYNDEVELSLWRSLGDLEALNMTLANSELQRICGNIRNAANALRHTRVREGKKG